jgi:hypothetical protein
MHNLSTRKFLISGLAAVSLVLAGCLTDSKDDGEPKITTHPASQTVAVGDSIHLSVVATGDAPLSYKWIRTTGSTVDTLSATTSSIHLVAGVQYDGASVVCVVSNAKGSVTSNAAVLTVTGTAWPAADTLTLGAQANTTLGSVIDLDSGKVWTSATANANQAKIDLVYLYYNSTATLNGASAARDSGIKYNINLTNTYNALQVKNIMMVKVTAKPASQHHAKAAYDSGTKVRSTVVAAGDKFVVLSTENKYMYVEVTSVAGTNAGTAGLSISIGTLSGPTP